MRNRKLFKAVLFSILAALNFAVMYINIKLPTGGFIHLGNLICVLTALLIGGVYGGLVGSLGMGLYDIIYYPTSFARTLILKFLMGLIAGYLFRYLRHNGLSKKGTSGIFITLSLIFKLIFAVTLTMYVRPEWFNDKAVHVIVPISIAIFSLIFDVALFFLHGKSVVYDKVLIAVSVATIFNIMGEFVVRVCQSLIRGEGFSPALIQAIVKVPDATFTGVLTICFSTLIFIPVQKALSGKFADIIGPSIDDILINGKSRLENKELIENIEKEEE